MRAEKLQVSVVTFNAAIQACQKCRRWKQALQLLQEMQSCNKQPNLVTYNGVLPEYLQLMCFYLRIESSRVFKSRFVCLVVVVEKFHMCFHLMSVSIWEKSRCQRCFYIEF